VHKGRQVGLDETLATTSFDLKDTDAFYNWASRRSEYVAAANVSSARAAGTSGLGSGPGCGGFATTTNGTLCNSGYGYGSPYGYGGYGSPYGMWAWNPYFGMFTYLPGMGYGYKPLRWAFYSPYTVGALYVPGLYSPYATGSPRYTNTGSGPTALGGARQSPASLSGGSSAPLRAAGKQLVELDRFKQFNLLGWVAQLRRLLGRRIGEQWIGEQRFDGRRRPRFRWRRSPIGAAARSRRASVYFQLILFGIAFGYLEAAVVVYLRTIGAPIRAAAGLPGQELFPLLRLNQLTPATMSLVKIELAREASTLITIWAVSQTARNRLGAFVLAFGVWDLTFYLCFAC